MLPIGDDNPVSRRPIVTWLIIAACLVAYFFWQPTPFSETVDDIRFDLQYAAIPCELLEGRPLTRAEVQVTFNLGDDNACGIDRGQTPPFDPGKNVWLAVVTSMFLHGSLLHIGGNLLFLWIFGNNVEDRLGRLGFAAFYLAGGVIATLAHVAVSRDSTVPSIGASGAIAAVMGAYLVWFPNARVRTLVIILLVNVPAKVVLVVWFVLQFFTDPNERVAWVAHVGGFVFGVLVALMLRRFGDRARPRPVRHPDPWSDDFRRFGGRY
ncbi:MAG: rhomboid family intramembrane serine protease [Acidimicrobiales bacterium]